MPTPRRSFFSLIVLSLAVTAVALSLFLWYARRGLSSTGSSLGGDFTLQSESGPWRLTEHVKPLTLLYFGYVHCPDVCPMTMSFAGGAFRKLNASQLEKLQFVFVSVDSEHDRPADAAKFARNFFASFRGLTGPTAQIDSVVNQFGASYMVDKDPKSYLGYSIAHTDRIFFLDEYGKVVDSISNPRSDSLILDKIKEHL